MGKFTLLYDIFSDAGVLSLGSYVLPLSNAQAADIGRVARSTNPLNASTIVGVDLGTSRPVGGIAVGPINASPGASYRVRSFSDAAMATTLYDSGVKTISGLVVPSLDLEWEDPGFWYGIDVDAIDNLPTWIVEIIPVSQLSQTLTQWFKIEIFDTANADGYVEFGRVIVARAWRPSFNYTFGDNSFTIDPRTEVVESHGGLELYDERGQRRKLRVGFENLPEDELFGDVFRMMNRQGISRQVYVVPDPDDSTYFQRRSFLATFTQAPAIAQAAFVRGSTVLDFKEVL